ncbi:MAG: amidohydrolase family protein [Actinomycetota bacterium]|nr:amidohydrolase family protein [Actinomycetota bacterium]
MTSTDGVVRGRVITPDDDLADAVVEIAGERITGVRAPAEVDPPDAGRIILPGLVDLHCHGGGGGSFTTADPDQVATAAAHHLGQGTTTLVGSAVTDSADRLLTAVGALADAVADGILAAIHLEGPFLSAARCGAQDPAHLRAPDLALAAELVAAGRGHVRMMTVAPELPGAGELAELLTEHGVTVAVGHTDADAATVERFLHTTSPSVVTHLFNGMAPIHHRDPGAVLGALAAAAAGDAVVELIADGVHLADETVAVVRALVGSQVVLVTDAMAAAGMADGDYDLGPQAVRVRDGVARLAARDTVAGGTSRLLDVVRRQVGAGLDPVWVVAAASSRPAAVLGIDDVGLASGNRADLVIVDSEWQPVQVMRAGAWV